MPRRATRHSRAPEARQRSVKRVAHVVRDDALKQKSNSFTGRAPVTLNHGRDVGRAPVQYMLGGALL